MYVFFLSHYIMLLFFFFFSSRRRHTRLQGDWSSDVCSSDLTTPAVGEQTRRCEERSGHESLQTPATALEAEVCTAGRHDGAGPLPGQGRGEGPGGGRKKAIVAHG